MRLSPVVPLQAAPAMPSANMNAKSLFMRSRASQGCGEHQHQLAWRAGREGALGGEGRLDVAVRRVREVRRVVVLAELVLRVEEVLPGEPEVEDAPAGPDRGVGDED